MTSNRSVRTAGIYLVLPCPSRRERRLKLPADMFRALGDAEKLRLLLRLADSEACVSELAEHEGEKITTV